MKIILNLVFMSMLGFGLITTLDSCQKVQGCTDTSAENYNPDADESDGTCVFARDKFIGTFNGSLNCQAPLPNDEDFSIVIAEGLANNSEVTINFQNLDTPLPELSARVEENKLIIDPEQVSVSLDPNNPSVMTDLVYSGEATISGDNLSGQLETKVIILGQSAFCDINAVRQ